jgi:hypothetical protein
VERAPWLRRRRRVRAHRTACLGQPPDREFALPRRAPPLPRRAGQPFAHAGKPAGRCRAGMDGSAGAGIEKGYCASMTLPRLRTLHVSHKYFFHMDQRALTQQAMDFWTALSSR